jgi:hypothetical protein
MVADLILLIVVTTVCYLPLMMIQPMGTTPAAETSALGSIHFRGINFVYVGIGALAGAMFDRRYGLFWGAIKGAAFTAAAGLLCHEACVHACKRREAELVEQFEQNAREGQLAAWPQAAPLFF